MRRDDVDVEDSELAEPVAVEPARLVDIVLEDRVQAIQGLDIEVGVVAQLVREGIARPGQLRGRVEDHDAVLTHHVARDAQERLAVPKDVPSLGRHLELDAGRRLAARCHLRVGQVVRELDELGEWRRGAITPEVGGPQVRVLEPECPQDVIGSALRELVAGVAQATEGLGRWRRAAREVDRREAWLVALEESEHAGRIEGPAG